LIVGAQHQHLQALLQSFLVRHFSVCRFFAPQLPEVAMMGASNTLVTAAENV
jgi:hypothetical protein